MSQCCEILGVCQGRADCPNLANQENEKLAQIIKDRDTAIEQLSKLIEVADSLYAALDLVLAHHAKNDQVALVSLLNYLQTKRRDL